MWVCGVLRAVFVAVWFEVCVFARCSVLCAVRDVWCILVPRDACCWVGGVWAIEVCSAWYVP